MGLLSFSGSILIAAIRFLVEGSWRFLQLTKRVFALAACLTTHADQPPEGRNNVGRATGPARTLFLIPNIFALILMDTDISAAKSLVKAIIVDGILGPTAILPPNLDADGIG